MGTLQSSEGDSLDVLVHLLGPTPPLPSGSASIPRGCAGGEASASKAASLVLARPWSSGWLQPKRMRKVFKATFKGSICKYSHVPKQRLWGNSHRGSGSLQNLMGSQDLFPLLVSLDPSRARLESQQPSAHPWASPRQPESKAPPMKTCQHRLLQPEHPPVPTTPRAAPCAGEGSGA